VKKKEALRPRVDAVAAWHDNVRERASTRVVTGASPHEKYIVIVAIAVALLAHLLAAWWLQRLMHSRAGTDEDRIEVRLLDDEVVQPPLPVAERRVPQRHVQTLAASPSMRSATAAALSPLAAVQTDSARTTHSLQVFDSFGAIHLPAEEKNPSFGPKDAREIAYARELMKRGHNMLHCRRRDNPHASPEEIANNAARGREMYSGMFHYPASDAMLDRAIAPRVVADTREAIADKEARAQAVCDEAADDHPAVDEAGADTP
jgi:hypothetical protein